MASDRADDLTSSSAFRARVADAFVVVLGCKVKMDRGALGGELGRRVLAGARAFRTLREELPNSYIIVSGGVRWGGVCEADAMRKALERHGVEPERVLCERKSQNTNENAKETGRLVRSMLDGPMAAGTASRVVLVTSGWHLPRAVALFRREGMAVHGHAAESKTSLVNKTFLSIRETIASVKDGVF